MNTPRQYLTDPVAINAAKILLSGKTLPAKLAGATAGAQVVMDAVLQGWFLIPKGKSGKYTRNQFATFSHYLAKHPEIPEAQSAAQVFMQQLPERWERPLFELFGSSANKRFPNPLDLSRGLSYRCPRMPLNFVAGAIGTEEFCDLLDDVSNNCTQLKGLVSTLSVDGMLDPRSELQSKTVTLLAAGLINLLPAVLHSVHRMYLDSDAQRALRQVMYNGKPMPEFLLMLAGREQQNRQENQQYWKSIFSMVGAVASVLANSGSYHQATLTKKLRASLGQRFRLARIQGPSNERIVVEIDAQMRLGESSSIHTEFELVNWVIALDEHLVGAEPTIYGYLEAAGEADKAITRIREEIAA